MVNVVDYLVAHGVLGQVDGQWALQGEVAAIETGVPESLQQMIERQLERLSEQERRILAVASVVGCATRSRKPRSWSTPVTAPTASA